MEQAIHHIRIAPYVAQIPLWNPATVAQQVLAVDHISNGRVESASAVLWLRTLNLASKDNR